MASNGGLQFSFVAVGGVTYTVQAATNLSPANWLNILRTNSPASTVIEFSDPDATNYPVRFYRVER